jgi:hypothetical protein
MKEPTDIITLFLKKPSGRFKIAQLLLMSIMALQLSVAQGGMTAAVIPTLVNRTEFWCPTIDAYATTLPCDQVRDRIYITGPGIQHPKTVLWSEENFYSDIGPYLDPPSSDKNFTRLFDDWEANVNQTSSSC